MLRILNYLFFYHKHPGFFFHSLLDFVMTVFLYGGLIVVTASFFASGSIVLNAFILGLSAALLAIMVKWLVIGTVRL